MTDGIRTRVILIKNSVFTLFSTARVNFRVNLAPAVLPHHSLQQREHPLGRSPCSILPLQNCGIWDIVSFGKLGDIITKYSSYFLYFHQHLPQCTDTQQWYCPHGRTLPSAPRLNSLFSGQFLHCPIFFSSYRKSRYFWISSLLFSSFCLSIIVPSFALVTSGAGFACVRTPGPGLRPRNPELRPSHCRRRPPNGPRRS